MKMWREKCLVGLVKDKRNKIKNISRLSLEILESVWTLFINRETPLFLRGQFDGVIEHMRFDHERNLHIFLSHHGNG